MASSLCGENVPKFTDELTNEELTVYLQNNKCGFQLGVNEEKNQTLNYILKKESEYQADLRAIYELYKQRLSPEIVLKDENQLSVIKLYEALNSVEVKFLASEKETQIPDDYSFFVQRNEQELEKVCNSST
jgi:hypothetical protein